MRGAPDESLISGAPRFNRRFHSSSQFYGMNEPT